MRILLVSEAWLPENGPYETIGLNVAEVLTEMGHVVHVVDNKKNYLPAGGNTMWDYKTWMCRSGFVRANNIIVNKKVCQAATAFRPEVTLLLRAENITCRTLEYIRSTGNALLMNWNHDSPFTWYNTTMEHLRSLSLYDIYFVLAQHLIPTLKSTGAGDAIYLPMYFGEKRFDLTTRPSAEDQKRYACDVLFVGNGSRRRADLLRPLADMDFALWGDWSVLDKNDPLRRCVKGSSLDHKGYAAAVQCSKVSINVFNQQCVGANNLRTFEVPGLGGCLLTEYSHEQASVLYEEDKHIACFHSDQQMVEKVKYLLDHPAIRQQMAAEGQAHTLAHHTLRCRLETIMAAAQERLSVKA